MLVYCCIKSATKLSKKSLKCVYGMGLEISRV